MDYITSLWNITGAYLIGGFMWLVSQSLNDMVATLGLVLLIIKILNDIPKMFTAWHEWRTRNE